MFNFIYSIIKRCNIRNDKSFYYRGFIFLILFIIALYFVFPIIILYFYFKDFFNNLNTTNQLIVCISVIFIIIYPFFRILKPGYIYLEKVQNYNTIKAYIFLLVLLSPMLIYYYLLTLL